MAFENTLAQIPGLGGYLAKRQLNDQQGMNELTQASGAIGVLSKLQEQQERAQIKDALSTTQSFDEAVLKLRRIGTPAAINSIKELTMLKNSEMEMAQKQREAAPFTKENLARNMIPGSPAITPDPQEFEQSADQGTPIPVGKPAVAPRVDMDAIGREVALTGMKGFEANATREATMQARKDALMTRLYQIQLQSQDKNISLAQQKFLAEQADQTKRMIAALVASGRPQPKDDIINTATGIYTRDRSGNNLSPLVDPATGEALRPPTMTGGTFERGLSKDFENHPAVKAFIELQPDVQVVNNYMKRRPSVAPAERAANDKNLVNTYMRMTHPKGDQISNFERKDLGAMPDLPSRIEKGIVGFFEGSYVPDDVAREMASVINNKFIQRKAQVSDIENKFVQDAVRNRASPDAIRKVTRGTASTPPPPSGFVEDK